jgi:hypothetical protein
MATYQSLVELLEDQENAVSPGPGKFEGTTDERIAVGLYSLVNDVQPDDQFDSSSEGKWYGLIGRFMVWEDSQGFFGYDWFDTEGEAKEAFLAEAAEYHGIS